MCIWRVAAVLNRLICRIANTSPVRGPVADVEGDLGVGESPGAGAAEFVGVDALGEQCLFDVGGGTFAPGQGVEPGRVQVGEQGRGPAAAVEPDQHPAIVADGGAQLGDQPAQLGGQRGGRFGHHHQQRIPRGVAHPGLHRGRGGELQPRHMGFRDRPGALVGAHVPVDVEQRGLLGAVLGVAAGHRGDPVAGPAGLGEQPDPAADRLDLRRPVQTQHPPQRGRVDPGRALGAGLAQQGEEHALAQHRIQRIEPVRQRAVGGVRILDQPGRRQRGQRQQQSRQRCPRAPGEHRRRGRDQPETAPMPARRHGRPDPPTPAPPRAPPDHRKPLRGNPSQPPPPAPPPGARARARAREEYQKSLWGTLPRCGCRHRQVRARCGRCPATPRCRRRRRGRTLHPRAAGGWRDSRPFYGDD